MSQVTECAKLIRKELKEHYPNIKFSVTSSSFSMGTSISINYNHDTELDNIRELVSKYEDGYYNHFEDIHEYYNNPEFEHLPKAKYIIIQRNKY